MKNKVALIYDFDKTLSPKDMQEFHYIYKLGYKKADDFWNECGKNTMRNNMDGILSYMYLMIKKNPNCTKKELRQEGKYIKYYKGVETWFKRINDYGKKNGIIVEHYIISSGIKEIIEGTSIAKNFKKIYACSYAYDEKGKVTWPSRVVNYTVKTQYIYRINKGRNVLKETNDFDLNRSIPDSEKEIPISNMIYFGDGLTDVPSMKSVKAAGGNCVAVYADHKAIKKAKELTIDKRADFMVKADYSAGSKAEKVVKSIIDKVAAEINLDKLK